MNCGNAGLNCRARHLPDTIRSLIPAVHSSPDCIQPAAIIILPCQNSLTIKPLTFLTSKRFFMQRYNMFDHIHKGLRAMLYETALLIKHADFWNVEEAEAVIERINDVIHSFEQHADTEDTYVFPAVRKYEPSVADVFEQEH